MSKQYHFSRGEIFRGTIENTTLVITSTAPIALAQAAVKTLEKREEGKPK